MGNIFFAVRLCHRSYTMGSNISEYCMHPYKIWLILFDFFIETSSSPEGKWRHEHQGDSHPSTHTSLIPIYLYIFPDTTERYSKIVYILLSSSDHTHVVRDEEYPIHTIRETRESLCPYIIAELGDIDNWELSVIENPKKRTHRIYRVKCQ